MADYDSNTIRPVKGLETIAGLNPARRREEGKRRQQMQQEEDESSEDKETQPEKRSDNTDAGDGGGIDYRA